jgi:hypothetical protein
MTAVQSKGDAHHSHSRSRTRPSAMKCSPVNPKQPTMAPPAEIGLDGWTGICGSHNLSFIVFDPRILEHFAFGKHWSAHSAPGLRRCLLYAGELQPPSTPPSFRTVRRDAGAKSRPCAGSGHVGNPRVLALWRCRPLSRFYLRRLHCSPPDHGPWVPRRQPGARRRYGACGRIGAARQTLRLSSHCRATGCRSGCHVRLPVAGGYRR